MIQEQALTETQRPAPSDPWARWAKLGDREPTDSLEPADESPGPASDESPGPAADVEVDTLPEPVVEPAGAEQTPAVDEPCAVDEPSPSGDLSVAVAQLTLELAAERRMRVAAEDARRHAEARAHSGEMHVARLATEVAAAQGRIAELERDRDEVIRRAEELLTAVRERADQRLAAQLEVARRHWSELLAEERRRAEALESERASLAERVRDAWLAAAVLRRSRPLRPRSSAPVTVDAAEQEVLVDLDANELDPAFMAESPEVAAEIENLRNRLRARRHRPPEIEAVEDGVDQLREARLARDADGKGRRRK